MEHRRNNEVDRAYNHGFNDGYSKGRYEVLYAINKLVDDNEYPEYFQSDVIEYLEMEGFR